MQGQLADPLVSRCCGWKQPAQHSMWWGWGNEVGVSTARTALCRLWEERLGDTPPFPCTWKLVSLSCFSKITWSGVYHLQHSGSVTRAVFVMLTVIQTLLYWSERKHCQPQKQCYKHVKTQQLACSSWSRQPKSNMQMGTCYCALVGLFARCLRRVPALKCASRNNLLQAS